MKKLIKLTPVKYDGMNDSMELWLWVSLATVLKRNIKYSYIL